jgi:hypothetical protein
MILISYVMTQGQLSMTTCAVAVSVAVVVAALFKHGLCVSTQKNPHTKNIWSSKFDALSALFSIAHDRWDIFWRRQNLASWKQEFSGVAKIPTIVSNQKKGGQNVKLAGSAQSQESTPRVQDGFFYVCKCPRPNNVRGLSPLPRAKRHSK